MQLNEHSELIYFLLPIIAFLYSSVGHGGASGYLALMAIFNFSTFEMKPTALLLNLFVAGISFIAYKRKGYFKSSLFLPFILTSIPLAYLGGLIQLDPKLYKYLLAAFLLFAIFKMATNSNHNTKDLEPINKPIAYLSGGVIGFLSGLIGIGGGIILTPLIMLFRWGNMREAAAVSALFIWVNSAAGLIGQFQSGATINSKSFTLVGLAIVGGLAGGYLGSSKINLRSLRYLLILVLLIACVKLVVV